MLNFYDWLTKNDPKAAESLPKDSIPGNWFVEHGLPMVVHCTYCESTLALPNAMIDDNNYIYCRNCASED